MKLGVIILAGGQGTRFNGDGVPKQFTVIDGKPILEYTIDIYKKLFTKIVIVLSEQYAWQGYSYPYPCILGGETRFLSAKNGYKVLQKTGFCDKIFIVDAVRCNTSDMVLF